MEGLGWVKEIEARANAGKLDPDDVHRLCRAVRELTTALDMVVQHISEDPSLLQWREAELRALLERTCNGSE